MAVAKLTLHRWKTPEKASVILALITTPSGFFARTCLHFYMQTARVNMCVCGHICVFVMPSDISQQASLLSAWKRWEGKKAGFPFVKNPIRLENAIITKWQLNGGGLGGCEINRFLVHAYTGEC